MKTKNYQWQGEPVDVVFGYSEVKTNPDHPMWWYNYECRETGTAKIPAVKVITTGGCYFILGNHAGIAIHKLETGGWPNKTHLSLPDDSFHADESYTRNTFEILTYRLHELKREEWQKSTYPKEWQKMQALKEMCFPPNSTKNKP